MWKYLHPSRPLDVPESLQPGFVPVEFVSVTAPDPWHAMRLGASTTVRILPEGKRRERRGDLGKQSVIAGYPEKTICQDRPRPIAKLLAEKCLSRIQTWEATCLRIDLSHKLFCLCEPHGAFSGVG